MPSDGVIGTGERCRVCGKVVKSLSHFAEKHLDASGRPCRGSDWHTVRVLDVSPSGVPLERK